MKTFSSFSQKAADNPNVSPIKLVKIEFDGITTYFCDRKFGDPGSEYEFDGQIYEPLILAWGDVKHGEVGQLGRAGTPSDFSFRVDNTVKVAGFDSFTSMFSIYKPIYSLVTLYEFYEGATSSSDLNIRFVGTIEDVDMELEYVNINCTSLEISVANQFTVEMCNEDDYPSADPDDWGKMLPIVYGSPKRVPLASVDAGAMNTLAEDINSSVTEFEGSDISKFPQGGGTIQIDYEEMTYTYIDGNTFKGVTRGANGTDALSHDTGATIAEIQTEYFFILGHPVKSIDAVYVVNRNNDENVLQDPSIYTAYTGQTGDEHASFPGKACVVFNTLPTIAPQVNLDVEDTIDVDDSIAVNDTIDVNDPKHGHGGDTYGIWHNEWGVLTKGSGGLGPPYDSGPSGLCDGSLSTYTYLYHGDSQIRTEKLRAEELGSLPKYHRCVFLQTFCDSGVRGKFEWGSGANYVSVTTGYGSTGIFRSGWKTSTFTSWAQIQSMYGYITNAVPSGTPGWIAVKDSWIEFIQDEVTEDYSDVSKLGAATKAGSADKVGTVELVGNSVADTVIGGRVSIDVQGWQADDSGDYGTEGDLIQRPDYIFKHFLVHYCGLTVADNIDSTSYGEAGTLYENDNVTLAVVILERPDVREFLSDMAKQCKSYEFWIAGKHYLKRVPVSETTNKTIEGGRIDIDSVKVYYTPRNEILNRYTINFDKYWIGDFESEIESYRGVVTVESTPSQAIYGVLEGDPLNLSYVNNSTQALRVGNWLLDDTASARLIVEFTGGGYLAELEEGDILEFTFESGDELDRRFLGLVVADSDQFRIMNVQETENGRIWIKAYFVASSTSNSGTFYPSQLNDDGYTQGANFYNTTVANMIGNYTGSAYTSTTTTTTSSTVSTSSTTSSTTTTTSVSTTSSSTVSSSSTISTTSSTQSTSSTSSTASSTSTYSTTHTTYTSFSTTTTTTTTTA